MNNPLLNLRDIHLPAPIHAGIPIGIWLLSVLLFSIGIVLLLYYYRKLPQLRLQKSALKRLTQAYQPQYPLQTCADISALLKSVALRYYPSAEIASLTGNAWVDFLTASAQGLDFSLVTQELCIGPYQPHASVNLELLYALARDWIKQRGRPWLP